jgi:hypothetical protein
VVVPELDRLYKTQVHHDPRDIDAARRHADNLEHVHLGVFFRDQSRPRYEELRSVTPRTTAERLQLLDEELGRYAV